MLSRKKRVLVDCEGLILPHFSGIGHYTLNLLRAVDDLLDTRRDLKFRAIVHYRHLTAIQTFGFRNIRALPSPFSHRIANALKIRGLQPPLDLLFGWGTYLFPNYSSWPLLFSRSIPFIYDLSYEKYPQFAEPRNQVFLSEQVRKAVARANTVFTISQNSKQEISAFYSFPKDRIAIGYPAVDPGTFYPRSKSEVSKAIKRYAIRGDYILFVGNIEPRKNLMALLKAYELLAPSLQEKYSLLLVGARGWRDNEITETIDRLQKAGLHIQLPSEYVDDKDLPVLYSGASVFVYPSIYEGFGIPPLEAMACGTPTITGNNSSLPEAVGNAAIKLDVASVPQLAAALTDVLTNRKERTRLARLGTVHAAQFSWQAAAQELLKAISL